MTLNELKNNIAKQFDDEIVRHANEIRDLQFKKRVLEICSSPIGIFTGGVVNNNCPSDFHLKSEIEDTDCSNCEKCWKMAFQDVEYLGIEEDEK